LTYVGPILESVMFFYNNRRFGIFPDEIEEGVEKIIVKIVEGYFIDCEIEQDGRIKKRIFPKPPQEAKSKTIEWVENHGLRKDLYKYFPRQEKWWVDLSSSRSQRK